MLVIKIKDDASCELLKSKKKPNDYLYDNFIYTVIRSLKYMPCFTT